MPTFTAAPKDNTRLDGAFEGLCYYDVDGNWSERLEPHLSDKNLNALLVRDFSKFTWGRWKVDFRPGDLPSQFDLCDCRSRKQPPHPRFWDYVSPHTCRWLVNFNLRLASLAEPTRPWRIIHSERHMSVWDGSYTLFDLNSLAFGVSPWDCFEAAYGGEFPPGRLQKTQYAGHHSKVAWTFTCSPVDIVGRHRDCQGL